MLGVIGDADREGRFSSFAWCDLDVTTAIRRETAVGTNRSGMCTNAVELSVLHVRVGDHTAGAHRDFFRKHRLQVT
jgi:hypothetical protein